MISNPKKKKIKEIEKSITLVSKLLESTKKKSSLIGWVRFSVFLAGLILFFLFFFSSMKSLSIITGVFFAILFIIVSVIQSKVLDLIDKQNKWVSIKQSHLARINLNWQAIPQSKEFGNQSFSPLEADLDLTGNRSLHQLIDYSKSRAGSLLLRDYFIFHPKDHSEIIKRQSLVKELLKLSHFREKFLLISGLSSNKELDSTALIAWLIQSNRTEANRKVLGILLPLCFINLLFITLTILGTAPSIWLISLLVYFGFYFLNQSKIKTLASDADTISGFLGKTIGILSFIENYNFSVHKNLEALSAPLKDKTQSPTRQINRINRFITFLSFRSNPFIWGLIILLFPIDYYLAYKVEKSKEAISKVMPLWLETWNKFEVYVSLSVFSNLNPDYNFPVITGAESSRGIINFSAEDIGHPLIPADQKICNNYTITDRGSISLVTGSNMSGKSTFLRTIGINLCLAYSGAPVNARVLNSSIMRLFSCIKVSDSVIDGISYFYAEVKRLKLLLDEIDLKDQPPVLFLIDEIFKGTNNIERLTGSRALIKLLAGKNCSGLISTHDLDLVKLADSLPSVSNFHFKEEIKEGKMLFDYKLNAGPCPTTNALIIMRTNGLPVD